MDKIDLVWGDGSGSRPKEDECSGDFTESCARWAKPVPGLETRMVRAWGLALRLV